MMRHLFGTLALAAVASVAGAQQTPPPSTMEPAATLEQPERPMTRKPAKKAKRYTTTSRGEVDRGGPGYSMRATSRDLVGAENTSGDDLWRREQMMDSRCGKSRERCGKP